MKSKTQQALDWMTATGGNANQAAKQFGISAACIYKAIAALARPRCPHCGQTIK